jgi:hypothetical protein
MLSMTPASLVSRPVSSKSPASARPYLLPVGPKKSSCTNRRQQRVHASSSSDPANDEAAAPAEALTSSPGAAALTAAAVKPEEANLFLDPLVRSLLLGVGAGMACETLHVVFKVRRRQLRALRGTRFRSSGTRNCSAMCLWRANSVQQWSVRSLQLYRGLWQLPASTAACSSRRPLHDLSPPSPHKKPPISYTPPLLHPLPSPPRLHPCLRLEPC